jgi:diguanylate cyclase (GGDEF)-like protein
MPGQFLRYTPDNLTRLYVVIAAAPAIALMVGVLRNHAMEALRREQDARLAAESSNRNLVALGGALDEIKVGIVLLDRELRVQFVNGAFRRIWRLSDAMADSRLTFVQLMYHGRDERAYATSPDGLGVHVAEQMHLIQAGDERPLDIRLAGGDVMRFRCKALPDGGRMLSYGDVSDLVQRGDKLAELASIDGLTGLYNRRHFLALAETEWSRYLRYGRPLALLVLDIDHFKSINDGFGHDVGDKVIKAVANVLQSNKRSSDIVGRVGGEEFALVLPEASLASACIAAERLRQKVADCVVDHKGSDISVTISIGMSVAHEGVNGIAALLKEADVALYEAKRTGRNRACAFDPAKAAAA